LAADAAPGRDVSRIACTVGATSAGGCEMADVTAVVSGAADAGDGDDGDASARAGALAGAR
jgi:hypothetical protein